MSKQQIEQLQQHINDLQQSLDIWKEKLDELRNPQPKKLEIAPKIAIWKPEVDDVYYYITDDDGSVIATSWESYSHSALDYHSIGNCFPSESLAEYFAARRAARQRLEMLALAERFSEGENRPYEPTLDKQYWVLCGRKDMGIKPAVNFMYTTNEQAFPTAAAAQRVLDAMTDEDCLLLWGTANRGDK